MFFLSLLFYTFNKYSREEKKKKGLSMIYHRKKNEWETEHQNCSI